MYKMAAIMASTGITAMAICAIHFRFTWHMRNGTDFPSVEAAATFLLTFGGVVRLPSPCIATSSVKLPAKMNMLCWLVQGGPPRLAAVPASCARQRH